MRYSSALITLLVVPFAVAACSPCEKLEERLCSDLGEADCKIWKDHDKPGFPGSGRRATRSCTNAMGNYDVHLKAVKASVDAYKKVDEAKTKTASAKDEPASADDSPAPPKKQHDNCAKLEEKLCTDLGDACEKWKANGKPGLIDNFVKCKWAVEKNKDYDDMLKNAKAGAK